MNIFNKKFLALTPLLVFLAIYLGLSIILNDFYKVPIAVAFLISSVYAIIISRDRSISERIEIFSKGAGSPNMMLMLWIFILAGTFANSAKESGAIDATVNLTLHALPSNLLLCGLFLASCFISLSIGTSVGTIVALTPVATGLAAETHSSLPLFVGLVVGGAFFGDNLSFISDTTIIATKTQGCSMKDKFRLNVRIVTPAAFITLIIYFVLGQDISNSASIHEIEWIKVLPYLTVLATAIMGMNVFVALTIGTILSGAIGMWYGAFDFFGWLSAMQGGINSMTELIIITLLAGGMMELIKQGGGIDFIISNLAKRVRTSKGAEMCIAVLVMITDFCTANNTVALITVGELSQQIAKRFDVDPRKSASILDTFSCFAQSLIPYGAQLLMAAGLSGISPIAIQPFLFYPFIMIFAATMSIVFRYPRKYNIAAILIIPIMLSVSSCKSGLPNLPTKEFTMSRTEHLEGEHHSPPQCSVEMKVKLPEDDKKLEEKIVCWISNDILSCGNDKSMKNVANTFYRRYINDYRTDCMKFYQADKSDNALLDMKYYTYRYRLTTDLVRQSENYITCIAFVERYEGGQSEIKTKFVRNFTADEYKPINKADIIIGGKEREIEDALLDALMKKEDCRSQKELKEKDFLASTIIYIPDNFIVKDNSVIFVFNEGEIAPFDKGAIELEIERTSELFKTIQ